MGVGGVRVGDAPLHHSLHTQPPARSSRNAEGTEASSLPALPAPPTGCRFLRVHRPVDRHGKVIAKHFALGLCKPLNLNTKTQTLRWRSIVYTTYLYILHHTIPHHIIPYNITPYHTVPYDMSFFIPGTRYASVWGFCRRAIRC